MSRNSPPVPDAWDDEDWESQADKLASELANTQISEQKVSTKATKAQRRAQHVEFNRQLWAEAETPQTFHFLETRSAVPLKADFRPGVTVLSRKPQIAMRSSAAGGNQADSDDEEGKAPELTPEERKTKAQREREEKQRKYEEVRERLFGSPATESGASTPGNTTPPKHGDKKGKGKGKAHTGNDGRDNSQRRTKRDSSASNKPKQLYDPDGQSRPTSSGPQRPRPQPQEQQQQPVRTPRGPDGSGRGGCGFTNRGGRTT